MAEAESVATSPSKNALSLSLSTVRTYPTATLKLPTKLRQTFEVMVLSAAIRQPHRVPSTG
jgi:hypothetical protein